MACTLRHTVCTRYLSPSRLASQRSTSHPGQSATAQHGLTHDSRADYRAPGPVLRPNSGPLVMCRRTGASKARAGSYLDFSSALKLAGAINIELPKASLPQKLRFRKNVDPSSSVEDAKIPAEDSSRSEVKNQVECDLNENQACDESAAKIKKQISVNVQREQLDFVSAMEQQDSSVKTYFSDKPGRLINPEAPSISKPVESKSSSSGAATLVQTITGYIPGLTNTKQSAETKKETVAKKKAIRHESVLPRSTVDRKTRGLVKSLRAATSSSSKLIRMEEFGRHMLTYPEAKSLAVKEKVIPCLLRFRASKDAGLREQAMETLAMVGYVDPVKGRGVRILSIDGGGTRGLVAIETLRRIEEACQRPIHQLFDYVCGVSTGSLISVMVGVHKLSLDETEALYKKFSAEMFQRHKLMGVSKLVMSHAYYDTQLWENILRENVGTQSFIESARDSSTPKISSVSTLMNLTKLSNFLFRNYCHPAGAQSQLPGSVRHAFWEAIRASSAAPGYYQEYKLDEWVHQDGGVIANNPTAIALHESRLLWPSEPLQCVVSIGTGRYEPTAEPAESTGRGLRDKINKIIQSATDTEGVHITMNDLLPPSTYFRFNPYMSEDFTLDEIRPDRWDQMTLDTQLYCRKNQHKVDKAATQLLLGKQPHQRARDWLKLRLTELGY